MEKLQEKRAHLRRHSARLELGIRPACAGLLGQSQLGFSERKSQRIGKRRVVRRARSSRRDRLRHQRDDRQMPFRRDAHERTADASLLRARRSHERQVSAANPRRDQERAVVPRERPAGAQEGPHAQAEPQSGRQQLLHGVTVCETDAALDCRAKAKRPVDTYFQSEFGIQASKRRNKPCRAKSASRGRGAAGRQGPQGPVCSIFRPGQQSRARGDNVHVRNQPPTPGTVPATAAAAQQGRWPVAEGRESAARSRGQRQGPRLSGRLRARGVEEFHVRQRETAQSNRGV